MPRFLTPEDGGHGPSSTGPTPAPGVASTALSELLRGPVRPVRVLAVFPAAAYLAHEHGVLALVAADGIHHPNAIVVARPTADRPFAGLAVHQTGAIGHREIEVGGLRVHVARWFDPVPHLRTTDPEVLRAVAADARAAVLAATGAPPDELVRPLAAVADALAHDDAERAVTVARRLVGAGPGLTPSGDDALAGLFAGTLALGRSVGVDASLLATTHEVGTAIADRAVNATTAVSAALLHHAARGETAAPATRVIRALTGRTPLAPALEDLLAVGATSGRDLSLGLLAAADLVVATVAASPPSEPSSEPTPPATTTRTP
jgi:hypothetical protein